jgi:hypothetical protein
MSISYSYQYIILHSSMCINIYRNSLISDKIYAEKTLNQFNSTKCT